MLHRKTCFADSVPGLRARMESVCLLFNFCLVQIEKIVKQCTCNWPDMSGKFSNCPAKSCSSINCLAKDSKCLPKPKKFSHTLHGEIEIESFIHGSVFSSATSTHPIQLRT